MSITRKVNLFLLIGIILGALFSLLLYCPGEGYAVSFLVFGFFLLFLFAFPQYFSLRTFLPSAIFIWSYILIIFIPSLYIYSFNKVERFSSIYLISVSSVLVFFALGIIVSNALFGIKEKEVVEYNESTLKNGEASHIESFFWLFALVSLFLLLYYLSVMPTNPLLAALRNLHDFKYLMQLREYSLKLLPVSSIFLYVFRWLPIIFFPILSILSYFIFMNSRKKIWFVIFVASLLIGLLVAGLTLAKIPAISFFFVIGFFFFLIGKRRRRQAVIFILASFVSAFLIAYIVSFKGLGVSGVMRGLLRRAFYVPSFTGYQYFEIFPGVHDFLHGIGMNWYSVITGKDFFNTANYVYRIYFPGRIESGLINTCLVGEAWSNFGFLGVAIESGLLGLILGWIDFLIVRILGNGRKTIYSVTLQSLLFPAMVITLNSSPLPSSLLTGGIIVSIVVVFAMKFWKVFNLRVLGEKDENLPHIYSS